MGKYGTSETARPKDKNLFAGTDFVLRRGLIKSGVEITRGMVLAREGDAGAEKYLPLARTSELAAAESIANVNANTHVTRYLDNRDIVPNSFTMEFGSNLACEIDPQSGRITFEATYAGSAVIDFKTGVIFFDNGATAINGISCNYRYYAADGSERSISVAVADLDTTSDGFDADTEMSLIDTGAVLASDLDWPADITTLERNQATRDLGDRGIVVKTR